MTVPSATGADISVLSGRVVHGFGRGSKTLGFPTANLESEQVTAFIDTHDTGIYAGFAKIVGVESISEQPFPAAISVGWNPTFKDVKTRVFEAHVIAKFPVDFYGATVRVAVCEKLRDERAFASLDELISAIQADCDQTTAFCAAHPHVASSL